MKKEGWYSARAVEFCGSFFYQDLDGKEVEVTTVTDIGSGEDWYKWEDKVFVGIVTKFIREGVPRNKLLYSVDEKFGYPKTII